ncbi:MAG: hypothetical protein DRN91_00865 [Candidatus Alkanophagales archaeon]|nr:MAG: hypothetical protein DRN91_00865 [Candidatus Alkanophagales archaeon]
MSCCCLTDWGCKVVLDSIPSDTQIRLRVKEGVPEGTIATVVLTNITNPQEPGVYNIEFTGVDKNSKNIAGESQPFELSGPSYTATALGTITGNLVHMADVFVDALAATSVPADLAEIMTVLVDIVEDFVKAIS